MSTETHPSLFSLPEGVSVRPVLKSGVPFRKRRYWCQDLARLTGRDIVVAADPATDDQIRCYRVTGEFICTATDINDPENARIAQEIYERHAAKRLKEQAEAVRKLFEQGKPSNEEGDGTDRRDTDQASGSHATEGCDPGDCEVSEYESRHGEQVCEPGLPG